MIVLSDTSAISNLLVIGHVHLLPKLFKHIIIPQSVYAELQRFQAFDIGDTLQASWLEVKTVQNQQGSSS